MNGEQLKETAPDLHGVRIALVTSVPFFLVTQLKGQVEFLTQEGVNMTVITSNGPELEKITWDDRLVYEEIEIRRKPSISHDVVALIRLVILFQKKKFHIVHSTTPKAGLLVALAGWIARVPIRLHTFTGQAWVTMPMLLRLISRASDRIIGVLNTQCYADSASQARFLGSERIISENKIKIIGEGSLAGVNTERFSRDCIDRFQKEKLRSSLGLNSNSVVLIYIGRVTRDKGILELLQAFNAIRKKGLETDLVIVGPLEIEGDTEIQEAMDKVLGLHVLGYQDKPEHYLAISDVLCLPSYREGFGTVVIEAAAMELPAIGTRIPGLVDAIIDGETGLLVELKDCSELEKALSKLVSEPRLRHQLGEAARKRCLQKYDSNLVNSLLATEYAGQLDRKYGSNR